MTINIFDLPEMTEPLKEELVTILAADSQVRLERVVSQGQTTDWYNQEETEFVLLLQGQATLEFIAQDPLELSAGDMVLLSPHEIHRVSYTSQEPPCVWLCFFW